MLVPTFAKKRFISVFILITLVLGLIVTVILTLQPQGAFETRKKAADMEPTKSLNSNKSNNLPVSSLPTRLPTEPVINFILSLEKRSNQSIFVTLYGFDADTPTKIVKLGVTTTNDFGEGRVILPTSYIGKKLLLFAETPSHLRKEIKTHYLLEIKEGNNPVDGSVDFGEFIAGDVYLDATGYKNNLIDSLDAATITIAIKDAQNEDKTRNMDWADLNGDGLIDSVDLTILSSNLGKKGDYFPLAK